MDLCSVFIVLEFLSRSRVKACPMSNHKVKKPAVDKEETASSAQFRASSAITACGCNIFKHCNIQARLCRIRQPPRQAERSALGILWGGQRLRWLLWSQHQRQRRVTRERWGHFNKGAAVKLWTKKLPVRKPSGKKQSRRKGKLKIPLADTGGRGADLVSANMSATFVSQVESRESREKKTKCG